MFGGRGDRPTLNRVQDYVDHLGMDHLGVPTIISIVYWDLFGGLLFMETTNGRATNEKPEEQIDDQDNKHKADDLPILVQENSALGRGKSARIKMSSKGCEQKEDWQSNRLCP